MQARMYAQVIVDLPIAQPLDYAIECDGAVAGRICVVPVGRRERIGIIVATATRSAVAAAKVRPIKRVLGEIDPLSTDWLALTRFAADYYQHAWGEAALPALAPALRAPPGPRFASALKRLRSRAVLPAGATHERGHARRAGAATHDAEATDGAPRAATFTLNEAQRAAVAAIDAATGFRAFLLFGVTGSGKTEVYLEAIAHRLAADPRAQALLLVPEINLTPQLQARLRRRFPGETIAALHSGMAAGERTAAWLAAHEGRARIVVGTRLAVFAPLAHLGIIVIDEEHDASFKAADGVRYSARDLAIKRGQLVDAPVVLGSATPSLETWSHARAGRYALLELPDRTHGAAAPPTVELIDTRQQRPVQGLAPPLRAALAATVARGEQALVFINRRGYAPVVACEACGWLSNCPRCAAFAAFHKTDATLRCHHCGWAVAAPRACPTCGNQDLRGVGQGTQRIEEALRAALPGARIARIDRDSTRRKHAASSALDAVHAGAVDVLVGTQMIAKGHDFRRVTLVGVLNADAQLVSHDFRAPERLFSTLVQVGGRAGRGGQASRVLVQTRFPSHPLFAAFARADFAAFADRQLEERRAAAIPPFVYQALLRAEARRLDDALAFLAAARAAAGDPAGVRLYDPVPMPLARIAGVHRAQLLIEADRRPALQSFLKRWLQQLREDPPADAPRARWYVEVDPLEI
jgi:primosomal protein N' (replication factor Y)